MNADTRQSPEPIERESEETPFPSISRAAQIWIVQSFAIEFSRDAERVPTWREFASQLAERTEEPSARNDVEMLASLLGFDLDARITEEP